MRCEGAAAAGEKGAAPTVRAARALRVVISFDAYYDRVAWNEAVKCDMISVGMFQMPAGVSWRALPYDAREAGASYSKLISSYVCIIALY